MKKKLPIAIQLYGLRDILNDDPKVFRDVMQKVKALGYDGVEMAGLYNLDPVYIRETLHEIGLIPVSAHVMFDDLERDIDTLIRMYSEIGIEYMVLPYVTDEYRPSNPKGFRELLARMRQWGEKIRSAGMTFLYHNHDFEFVKTEDGRWGYDVLFAAVDKEYLKCELDCCWCDVATGQTVEFIRKYSDRLPVVHLKDYIKKGDSKNILELLMNAENGTGSEDGYFVFRSVGFGQMLWEPVLQAVSEADTKWLVVEQDEHYDLDPLECARRSREYLRILGW